MIGFQTFRVVSVFLFLNNSMVALTIHLLMNRSYQREEFVIEINENKNSE